MSTITKIIAALLSFLILALAVSGAIVQSKISPAYMIPVAFLFLLTFSTLLQRFRRVSFQRQVKVISSIVVFCLLPLLISVYYSIFRPIWDSEWYYVPIITSTGHTWRLLELGQPLYYALWPIPQIIAACIVELTSINTLIAYVLLFVLLYETFIITTYITSRSINSNTCRCNVIYYVMLSLVSIYYLHRAFHDLLQDAFGMYSLLFVIYIVTLIVTGKGQKHEKVLTLLLVLMSVLIIAHGLAIYVVSTLLLLLAVFIYITGHTRISFKIVLILISVFFSTYIFQLSSGLLTIAIHEVRTRPLQLISVLLERGFNRPSSAFNENVRQQQLHFVYPYNAITVPIAYVLPVLTCLLISIILISTKNGAFYTGSRRILHVQMLTLSIFSLVMLTIALIFGYYGIENAIARYLYFYGSVAYPISFTYTCLVLSREANFYRRHLRLLFELTALLILICWMTEVFYVPWFSFYKLFDTTQLEQYLKLNIFDYIYHVRLKPLLSPGIHVKYYILLPLLRIFSFKRHLVYYRVYSSDVFVLVIPLPS